MPRYALKLEYDGSPYVGWQRQIDLASVQGTIEAALARIEPGDHQVIAAGRTDAGVHALGQYAHCDLTRNWTPFRLSEALNFHLRPAPIAVVAVAEVSDDWHARFTALDRRYLYRVLSRRPQLVHQRGRMWHVKARLSLAPMQEAAALLIGRHDFTTFRATNCQAKSPVKNLDEIEIEEVEREHGTEFRFRLRARSFLHNQVRSIVGSLERVGSGSWTPQDVAKALAARDRAACGAVAPAHGLYLADVTYPEPVFSKDTP